MPARTLTLGALLLAMGLVLPALVHIVGMGRVLLPMLVYLVEKYSGVTLRAGSGLRADGGRR